LAYLDHAPRRAHNKSARGFSNTARSSSLYLKKITKFSRNFLTTCDSHSRCLLKNLRRFITQLEAGYQRTGPELLLIAKLQMGECAR
jgi:hypothetical protein